MAERLLGELEADPRARRRLAELLVAEPDVRLAMINAIIADVATRRDLAELRSELKGDIDALRSEVKGDINALRSELKGDIEALRAELKRDIEALRAELKGDINALRAEMGQLRSEMRGEISALRAEIAQLRAEASSNFRWIIGTILAIWGATVIPILLRLIGAI